MNWRLLTAVSYAVLTLTLVAVAQALAAEPQAVTASPTEPVTVLPGRVARIHLRFRVPSGLHINSHKPNSELAIPTRLNLNLPIGFSFINVTYPTGHVLAVSFSNDKLSVYTGDFEIEGTVDAARTVRPGTYQFVGSLQYQACSDRECFPPRRLPVEFEVMVK